MYIVSYYNGWVETVTVAIGSTKEIAEAIIERLRSAADPATEYVYYNGHNINTCTLYAEYIPEWTEDYLHERGRMSC